MTKKKKNKKSKNSNIVDEYEIFGDFAFIAGYTEGGMPYGILAEDMVDESEEESKKDVRKRGFTDIDDEDLPF